MKEDLMLLKIIRSRKILISFGRFLMNFIIKTCFYLKINIEYTYNHTMLIILCYC